MRLASHVVYDLLEAADHLLSTSVDRSDLLTVLRRRAISTAYYATFQAICFVVASVMADWSVEDDSREIAFRTPDHRPVKERLTRAADPQLKALGAAFSALQERRNEADYASPRYRPTYVQAATILGQAKRTVELIEALSDRQRRLLVLTLLTRPRT